GVIRGNIAGSLPNRGSGTLTLSGPNTSPSQTIVQAGTLLVTGSIANSLVNLAGGTLAGTGTVKGINATGGTAKTVSPGTSPGILSSGFSVSFNASTTFTVELNGATAGGGYDQLNVTGIVGLDGATLNASLGSAPAAGTQFKIIQNDSTDPVQGTFAGLPEGASLTINSQPFVITYQGGSGNDVVLIFQQLIVCAPRPAVNVQSTNNG